MEKESHDLFQSQNERNKVKFCCHLELFTIFFKFICLLFFNKKKKHNLELVLSKRMKTILLISNFPFWQFQPFVTPDVKLIVEISRFSLIINPSGFLWNLELLLFRFTFWWSWFGKHWLEQWRWILTHQLALYEFNFLLKTSGFLNNPFQFDPECR